MGRSTGKFPCLLKLPPINLEWSVPFFDLLLETNRKVTASIGNRKNNNTRSSCEDGICWSRKCQSSWKWLCAKRSIQLVRDRKDLLLSLKLYRNVCFLKPCTCKIGYNFMYTQIILNAHLCGIFLWTDYGKYIASLIVFFFLINEVIFACTKGMIHYLPSGVYCDAIKVFMKMRTEN